MHVDNCCHHVVHPFSTRNIELKRWQKGLAYASLALSIFGIVPGFLAFYGISYYFKSRRVSKSQLVSNLEPPHKSVSVAKPSSKKSESKPSQPIRHMTVEEAVQDLLATSPLPPPKPPKQMRTTDTCIQLDDFSKGLLLKSSIDHTDLNLPRLRQHQTDLFFQLFEHALKSANNNLICACLSCVGKDELEKFLQQANLYDCELKFGSKSIHTNRALLSATCPYFERMFASGMAESHNGHLDIEDCSFDLFSQLLDCAFFNSLTITGDNLEEFLFFANRFELGAVTRKCDLWVLQYIDRFDQEQLFALTAQYDLEQTINALAMQSLRELSKGKPLDHKILLWMRDATELNLSAFYRVNLTPFLKLCKNLKSLNLSECTWIIDKLNDLKHLNELETLDLSNSNIWDLSPLVSFKSLRHLDLSDKGPRCADYNDISVLSQLVDLESLNLTGSYFIKDFEPLKSLRKLKRLGLPGNISDISVISHLTDLKELTCPTSRKIKNISILNGFSKLEKLEIDDGFKNLDLNNFPNLLKLVCRCELAQEDFDKLDSLKHLKSFSTFGENLTNISALRALNLEKLSLKKCLQLTDLSPLVALTSLKKLEISRCESENIDSLASLTNLRKLVFTSSPVKDISPLSRLTNLENLELNYNKNVQNIEAFGVLINLKILRMRGLSKVADSAPLRNLKSLKLLNMMECSNIQDFSFLSDLKKLRELYLDHCKISDLTPISSLKKLRYLSFKRTLVQDLTLVPNSDKLTVDCDRAIRRKLVDCGGAIRKKLASHSS